MSRKSTSPHAELNARPYNNMHFAGKHGLIVQLLRRAYLYPFEAVFFQGRSGIDNADEGLRYLPISDDILDSRIENPSILEVGSGSKGITPYVPYHITGVDVVFSGDLASRLRPVSHSGEDLPFPDRSFDYVVCADMLEHVPSEKRPRVLSELIRVANKRLYLAVPCGRASEDHDRKLDDLHLRLRGERLAFLKEHVENGLPDKDDIVADLKASAARLGRTITISAKPNVNLKVRYSFMRLLLTPKIDLLFPVVSPFFCVVRNWLNFGDCYRQIIIVDINTSMPPMGRASD